MAEPLSVQLPCLPFDVAFHPTEPLVCAGLISGSVQLDSFSMAPAAGDGEGGSAGSSSQRCWRKKAHKEACRAVAFMEEGKSVVSSSSDQSLVLRDTETGKRVWANLRAHNAAVNRLEALSEATVASGDDDGEIKVWDVRQPQCCAAMSVHDDFIADMHHATEKHKLLAVSGDGTLSVFDLKNFKKEARSEYAEDELLSVTVVKGGKKVVCGSQEGVLLIYSWGHFSDCSDRFPGHPHSIDALMKLDENTVITGSQDGLIRLVSILPNGFRGVIGQHMDCPIERLALSGDGNLLASASHDNLIKLWDISTLRESPNEDDEEEEEEDEDDEGNKVEGENNSEGEDAAEGDGSVHLKQESARGRMGGHDTKKDEDEGDSDEDEEQERATRKRRKKPVGEEKRKGKKTKAPSRKNNFFKDL